MESCRQAISLGFVSLCVWLIATRRRPAVDATALRRLGQLHGAALFAIVLVGGALAAAAVYDRSHVRERFTVLVLSAAAMCVTPLGVWWWPEMIVSLARIRSISISEWQPPSLLQPADAVFWIVAGAVIVLAWRQRRELNGDGAVVIGMALALLPLALSAGRNVSPFLLVALPALTCVLPDRVLRWEASLARRPARAAHGWGAGAAAATAVVAVALAWSQPAPRLGWRPLPESVIAAIDACPANLYNRYDDGGFFIWFTPGQRVFLDGRQDPYPVRLIQDHRATETVGAVP